MTAATLAFAVFAPAAIDVGSREVIVWTMSSDSDAAAANAAAPTTSINVVAVRGTRLVPVVQSRARVENQFAGLTGRVAVPHPSERQGLPVSGTVAAMS